MNRRLDGTLSWSGCSEVQRNLVPLLGIEPIFLGRSARILFITSAKRSLHSGKWKYFSKLRIINSYQCLSPSLQIPLKFVSFFFVQCHHMSFVDFVVLHPRHGGSVTDFWGWDVHEAQLRCPDGVWVVIEEDVVPGGALDLNSTNLLRPWSPRESFPSRNIPTIEPGIEPGTS